MIVLYILLASLICLVARYITTEALFCPTWIDHTLLVLGLPFLVPLAALCIILPRNAAVRVVNFIVKPPS